MTSVCSVLCTMVLFAELNSHLVTVAMPANKIEDSGTDPDGLGLILGVEPMTEPLVSPLYRRSHVLDNSMKDEEGSPKMVFLSDMRPKGFRVLNPAFIRSFSPLSDQSRTPVEHSLKIDRRNTDLDILRCMIGRVYRPCWDSQP